MGMGMATQLRLISKKKNFRVGCNNNNVKYLDLHGQHTDQDPLREKKCFWVAIGNKINGHFSNIK